MFLLFFLPFCVIAFCVVAADLRKRRRGSLRERKAHNLRVYEVGMTAPVKLVYRMLAGRSAGHADDRSHETDRAIRSLTYLTIHAVVVVHEKFSFLELSSALCSRTPPQLNVGIIKTKASADMSVICTQSPI